MIGDSSVMETGQVQVIPRDAVVFRHELSVEEIIAQAQKIERVMREAMKEGVHYGTIPGTPKPTLFKAGAEKLNLVFRFDPQYQSTPLAEALLPDGHMMVKSVCTIWHIPTGLRLGSGEGSCSTRESKYAFRHAKRACPTCGAEQLNKSKFPPRDKALGTEPGWYCYAKSGGCGAEFAVHDVSITGQQVGLVANPNLADQYNTALKMANKRSLVAAVLNVTAASDIFTQDLEEMAENEAVVQGTVVPVTEPSGAKEPPPNQPPQAPPDDQRGPDSRPISDAQKGRMWAIAREHGWSIEEVKALYQKAGFEHAEAITRTAYETLINTLKDRRKEG